MLKILLKIHSALLNFFFPPECIGCGKEDSWICDFCIQKIQPDITRLSVKIPHFKYVWALTDYHKPITEKIIKRIKFRYCKEIIYDMRPFFRIALSNIPFPKGAILCPIPLHFIRKNSRGFNQAEVIAHEFSHITGMPVTSLLKRKRNTKPQTKLNGDMRRENLKNAFVSRDKELIKLKKQTPILLVDDVTTTFSTLEECAKCLKKSGYRNIYGLVVSRSLRHQKK